MSNPRCDECGIGCCLEDMEIVYESPDDSPIRTEHKFCSMSCMENYFFPDHKEKIKEKDLNIEQLRKDKKMWEDAAADLAEKGTANVQILSLRAEVERLRACQEINGEPDCIKLKKEISELKVEVERLTPFERHVRERKEWAEEFDKKYCK